MKFERFCDNTFSICKYRKQLCNSIQQQKSHTKPKKRKQKNLKFRFRVNVYFNRSFTLHINSQIKYAIVLNAIA